MRLCAPPPPLHTPFVCFGELAHSCTPIAPCTPKCSNTGSTCACLHTRVPTHVLQCTAHSSSHPCSLTRLWVCVLLHTRAPLHVHTHLLVHCHTPLHTHTRYTWAQIRACLQPGAHSHSHTVSCTPTPPLHNPSVHTQGCQCACTPTALCTPTSSHILCRWVWTGLATLARVAHPRCATHPLALGHCLGHACTLMHTHTRPLAHPRGVPPDLINPNRPHWPSQSHPPVPTP